MRTHVLRVSAACTSLLLGGCAVTSALGPSAPLDMAAQRPAALRFGMHVAPHPDGNPIDPPERFEGYHAALDYETFAWEQNRDVPVYSICAGQILFSGFAEGYGGLVLQRCTFSGEPATVIYGHLDGDGLAENGIMLSAGDRLGILAAPRSHWSDGNRKHLHLGIHRGEHSDVRGYVQTEAELGDFIDPRSVLPHDAWGRDAREFVVPGS